MPVPSEIVDIDISVEIQAPTQQGFSVGLLLDYHTKWPELVRTYDSESILAELDSEGFDSDDPIYLMAEAGLRQDPVPTQFKVGRSAQTPAAFTAVLTVAAGLAEGDIVSCTLILPDGTAVPLTYTLTSGQDSAAAATAFELLTEAVTGLNSAAVSTAITITGVTAGAMFRVTLPVNLTVKITTPSFSYDDALTAIRAVDDDFYGVMIGSNSAANLDDVMSWAESNKKIFFGHYAGETSDYLTWLATHTTPHRHFVVYTEAEKDRLYPGVEAGAYALANDPGSYTLMFKTLPGIEPSRISSGVRANIKTAHGNTFMNRGGLPIIQDGWASSGRFIDITHFNDFAEARIAELVYGWLARQKKVPYSNGSVDIVKSIILGFLTSQIGTEENPGAILADPKPTCTGPDVRTISTEVRATRLLPDIRFSYVYSNGIHAVRVRGTATF